MANIVGESTPSFVIKQVNKRQEIHGKINRTAEELNYLNTKTAWCKLVSSVSVESSIPNNTIKNLGLTGNQLAEKYVLFNGITNESPTKGKEETYQRSGIARNGSINNTNAYGVGGLEMGLSPMMGIEDAIITAKNRGSLKSAKVKIIANSRIQFEIIETLYIKLGYFMLLEWGWTNYFKGNEYIKDNPYSIADDFLLRKSGYDSLNSKILSNRAKSGGNYDAMIGKVTNFNWTFNPSGQYVIDIDLLSQGDVIESLKVNTLMPDDARGLVLSFARWYDATVDPFSIFDPFAEKTPEEQAEIKKEFLPKYEEYVETGKIAPNTLIGGVLNNPFFAASTSSSLAKEFARLSELMAEDLSKYTSTGVIPSTTDKKRIAVAMKFNGDTDDDTQWVHYIRFDYLLQFIEKNIIPTIEKGNTKFITFNTSVDNNLILFPNYIITSDPTICSWDSPWRIGDENGYTPLISGGADFETTIGDNTYGKLMYLYFSMKWILTTMKDKENENGDVVLIDFLNALLEGFQKVSGNYNKITADIDPDTNVVYFIDETAQPDRKSKEPTAFFNTFGYLPNGTSNFVRDLKFNTTVTPEMSTMISIGATRDGSSPGYDATGLRTINAGTFDAIKPNLVNNSGKPQEETEDATNKKKLAKVESKYEEATKAWSTYIYDIIVSRDSNGKKKTIIGKISKESSQAYANTQKTLIEYRQLKQTKDNAKQFSGSPTMGFIPFDLGLDIDGLSGIKIYNKISVETAFLPYNYPEALEFVVKGVDHKIKNNDWITSLTTLAIPKTSSGGGKGGNNVGVPTGKRNGGGGGGGSNPADWTDKTITSGKPLNPRGHDGSREYPKTQLLFHYSVTWQANDNGQNVIDVLNKRGLSYHYVIDGAGNVEQLVTDTTRAFHAGTKNPKLSANSKSIGINFQNIGYARKGSSTEEGITGKFKTKNQYTGNVKLVNYLGKPEPYKGHTYCQEISDAQLKAVKDLVKTLKKNNSGIPSYKWEGKKTFDQLFPPDGKTSYATSKPGLYTHNSNVLGKADILPTPKIVKFFKELVL
jgi:hypothetical protein